MILLAYVWKQLATDWDSLSDADKEALFAGTNGNIPTGADLLGLNSTFRVAVLSEDTARPIFNIIALPADKLFIPTQLIGSTFDNLDSVNFTVSLDSSSIIRFAITKDLTTYYTYNNGFVQMPSFDLSAVLNDGATADDIKNITDAEWDAFYGATYGDEGIAFAFAISLGSASGVASVDDLTVTADLRGEWRRAIHGTDYDYCYPSNDTLRVELLSDGNYKINYSKTSSDIGGGDLSKYGVPIGTVIAFMGNVAPTNYLPCDGKIYSIHIYNQLANFIHLQFGSYDYFGGDGIDTFAVPDLRGEFLRGTGANSHTNVLGELQGSGSDVGKHQSGTRMSIPLTFSGSNSASDTGWFGAYIPPKSAKQKFITPIDSDYVLKDSVGLKVSAPAIISGSSYLNKETAQIVRPTNTSVLYCIKYK